MKTMKTLMRGAYFLELKPRHIIRTLFWISALLIFCHILGLTFLNWSWQWERMFNLDFENNIPTWFSGLVWAGAAFVTFFISLKAFDSRTRILWWVLSSFFLFLFFDEIAGLHERFGQFIHQLFFGIDPNYDIRNWVFILAPAAITLCTWLGYQLREDFKNDTEAGKLIILGFVLFFIGAAGFDLMTGILVRIQSLNWTQRLMIIAEESLEMFGSILILSGFTEFFYARTNRLRQS